MHELSLCVCYDLYGFLTLMLQFVTDLHVQALIHGVDGEGGEGDDEDGAVPEESLHGLEAEKDPDRGELLRSQLVDDHLKRVLPNLEMTPTE